MPGIPRSNDAYGHELLACLTEGRGDEIVERDDGFIAASVALPSAPGDGPVYVAAITRTP